MIGTEKLPPVSRILTPQFLDLMGMVMRAFVWPRRVQIHRFQLFSLRLTLADMIDFECFGTMQA
jgi:hypothetical protein